jgi:HK97 family phage prohead protease
MSRETRNFSLGLEARGEGDNGGLRLVGYAVTYGVPYEVTDQRGSYVETMLPGSWKRTIKMGADIRYLENHEGIPFARTKSGTLKLTSDDVGVLADIELDPRQQRAQDHYYAVQRGDVDQMSVAFRVVREKWSSDRSERSIAEVAGFDVSAVTYPANDKTLVVAGRAEVLDAEDADAEPAEVRAGMSLRAALALASRL